MLLITTYRLAAIGKAFMMPCDIAITTNPIDDSTFRFTDIPVYSWLIPTKGTRTATKLTKADKNTTHMLTRLTERMDVRYPSNALTAIDIIVRIIFTFIM